MAEMFIRVDCTFPHHPKTRALEAALGRGSRVHVLDLWLWTAAHRPDGVFTHDTTEDIADAAGWKGDPEAFVEALLKIPAGENAGFAIRKGGILRLYHWVERNAWFALEEKRIKARLKKRSQRARQAEDAPPDPSEGSGGSGVPPPVPTDVPSASPSASPSGEARSLPLEGDRRGEESRPEDRGKAGAAPPSNGLPPEIRLWNELLPHPPFPRITTWTRKRAALLKARRDEIPSFAAAWRQALIHVKDDPFYRGQTSRPGWVCSPDFLLQRDRLLQIIEAAGVAQKFEAGHRVLGGNELALARMVYEIWNEWRRAWPTASDAQTAELVDAIAAADLSDEQVETAAAAYFRGIPTDGHPSINGLIAHLRGARP